jgi:hypothetical protein
MHSSFYSLNTIRIMRNIKGEFRCLNVYSAVQLLDRSIESSTHVAVRCDSARSQSPVHGSMTIVGNVCFSHLPD